MEDEQGKQILLDLYKVEGLTPAQDSDYAPVRAMAEVLELDVAAEVSKL